MFSSNRESVLERGTRCLKYEEQLSEQENLDNATNRESLFLFILEFVVIVVIFVLFHFVFSNKFSSKYSNKYYF